MGLRVELTDAQLVARCRTGDDDAWRELVDRFSRYVYAIAVQAFRLPEHDAEDVFQEVFARAYEHLRQAARRRRDPALARPAHPAALHRPAAGRLAASSPTDDRRAPDADDTIARLDEALAVHEALATLPDNCQEILDRFFARDESYRTIGEALDLPRARSRAGSPAAWSSFARSRSREEMRALAAS